MKKILYLVALILAVGVAGWWIAAGGNRGWTKTSIEVKTLDEVTGIEGIDYRRKLVPGVEVLVAGFAFAGVLGGIAALLKRPPPSPSLPTATH